MIKKTNILTVILLVWFMIMQTTEASDKVQIYPAKKTAFQCIDRNKDEIAKVGDAIFSFAELGMQEIETSSFCVQVLKDMGFKVESGISGFPTAVLATYGSGRPVIALHAEYDALPAGSQTAGITERQPVVEGAPGHAEGHNTGAAVMLGAAFAIKEAMDKHNLQGTLKVFGVPAEEQVLARPYFVCDGYFENVDAAFHCHVSDRLSTSYGIRQYALISVEYSFFGKTAHAASRPWQGFSALDAAKLMDIGFDVLREHLPPTHRSHSVIVDGGKQPNVVPEYARIWWYFRESTSEKATIIWQRARKIAEGAALMTGCTFEENVMATVLPTRDNQIVAETIQTNIELIGMPEWLDADQELARRIQKVAGVSETGLRTEIVPLKKATQGTSSNDSGDITWTVPHGRISFPSNISGAAFHHWTAGIAPATSIAHKDEVAGAKVMAGSVIDLLTQPELLVKAKELHKKEIGGQYKTLLPPDQKPPLELNKIEMEKYRRLMESHYYKPKVQFN